MATSSQSNASKADTPVFNSYVNAPLSTKKLGGCNYIKLWLTGQGYKDHLTTKDESMLVADRTKWEKIDARLCSVIKATIHSSLKHFLYPHLTCEFVWEQTKVFYTNDI